MMARLDQEGEDGCRLSEEAMRRLRLGSACTVDPGLTDSEIDRIEQEFGFRFAADHRAFCPQGCL
ncbi:SMI1/KNR4 family protein [Salinispora pacifica]|uniref:SMI1/KNR4 family protein n=1 Tax=Salinispora pacifica TaxID=351187 RepID=UPI000477706B|nr:SMI1/KNR4 family protein [Salinispora pacifica]